MLGLRIFLASSVPVWLNLGLFLNLKCVKGSHIKASSPIRSKAFLRGLMMEEIHPAEAEAKASHSENAHNYLSDTDR